MNWLTGTPCAKLTPHVYSQSINPRGLWYFTPEFSSHLVDMVHVPLSASSETVYNMLEWTVGEEMWLS